MTQKRQWLKSPSGIPLLTRTYLLCSPPRHSVLGSERIVVAIALMAANTFRFLRLPTSLKRSDLQNRSVCRWSPISLFTGRVPLNKVLFRRGIPTAWAWCRECKAHTDIVHCHLLFHLPVQHRSGPKLEEMKAHLVRLVDRHGNGILGEFAVRLVIWPDPDGLYLIKGGGLAVWNQFPRIRKDWRTAQGIIHGKRCGVSQNLGPTARLRSLIIQAGTG
jgi:hypothetical protein